MTVILECDRCGVRVPPEFNPVCFFGIRARGEKAEDKFRLDLCEACQEWAREAIYDKDGIPNWANRRARERILADVIRP